MFWTPEEIFYFKSQDHFEAYGQQDKITPEAWEK